MTKEIKHCKKCNTYFAVDEGTRAVCPYCGARVR